MISVDEALQIVLDAVSPIGVETIPLEAAQGRVLAEDVRADMDLPPFDRARMDGYALRSGDLVTTPAALRVIGEVAAGGLFPREVGPGEAVKIFTGAPMPQGADAVQKVEVTESKGDTVLIKEPVVRGQFVTPRASEAAAGQVVSEAGQEIGPAEMAVLASFGRAEVKVGVRPRVAVMSTGSELVEVIETPADGQIRNSNSYTITSYAKRIGARAERLGIIPDSAAATREALERAADGRHLVITSGGVSMGDYDLVKEALSQMGARFYFDKVRIRPGKPIVFARRVDTFFFGLPGNPVSTSVTFNLFVHPAIRRMQGDASPLLRTVRAELTLPISDSSSRRSYLPGLLTVEGGRALVRPLRWGGSSDLVAFVRANALIVVPEAVHQIDEKSLVDVVLLR